MPRYRDPFELARSIAGRTDPQITRYRHGSVLLDRKGRIIATGVNHFQGTKVLADDRDGYLDKTLHAEMDALRKINLRRLDEAVCINYARTRVAAILARPCPNCWAMLEKLGFRKVFYTERSDLLKPQWVEERF